MNAWEEAMGPPIHIIANTALTGATCDIDGGQQLIPG
jgi:hypothetical protein